MSQQRCEIPVGRAKQFGADGDVSGQTDQPYCTEGPGQIHGGELLTGTGA